VHTIAKIDRSTDGQTDRQYTVA